MEYLSSSETEEIGFFSPRGNLDGEVDGEFSEKEKLIGFKISDEVFYLPIANISEIIMLLPITYVPRSMQFIEGVINVRGTIVPTINLRKMMGYDRTTSTLASRIIIVKFDNQLAGILVDGITVVASFAPNEIENQILPSKNHDIEIITRVSKVDGKIRGILDSSRILACAGFDRNDQSESQAA